MTAVLADVESEGQKASTTRRGVDRRRHNDARRPPGVRSTPSRQRRRPWIALGLVMVFGAGLAFAAWSRSTSARVPVLVAARTIDAGEVVDAASLVTVEVNLGPGAQSVPVTERAAVVGRTARGPIPKGAVLAVGMLSDAAVIPDGSAVVGAVLAPGAYPVASLQPGDTVRLVAAAGSSSSAPVGAPSSDLGTGSVWAVSDPGTPGAPGLFVSVLVPSDVAGAVSGAAGSGQLRLVLVGGST
jgi:hypothetical protein